jgi:hypothetical protein
MAVTGGVAAGRTVLTLEAGDVVIQDRLEKRALRRPVGWKKQEPKSGHCQREGNARRGLGFRAAGARDAHTEDGVQVGLFHGRQHRPHCGVSAAAGSCGSGRAGGGWGWFGGFGGGFEGKKGKKRERG